MELNSVAAQVHALVATYDFALEHYTKWQRKKWKHSHYTGHDKGSLSGGGGCGLNASLSFSSSRIRQAYDEGAATMGSHFIMGDNISHEPLQQAFIQLQERVDEFYNAMTTPKDGSVDIASMLSVSESVRVSTLDALRRLTSRTHWTTAYNSLTRIVRNDVTSRRYSAPIHLDPIPDEDSLPSSSDDDSTTTEKAAAETDATGRKIPVGRSMMDQEKSGDYNSDYSPSPTRVVTAVTTIPNNDTESPKTPFTPSRIMGHAVSYSNFF